MRSSAALMVVVAALALCLGAPELFAQSKPVFVPSMNARPDMGQLQAAAWDWITSTVSSTPFLVGLGVGVVLAEATRFLLRWLLRAVGFTTSAFNLVVRYRLVAVAILGAVYYVAVHHVLGAS